MTIASAIQAKQQQVTDSYTAVNNKGGTLPATQNLSNLPTAINSIPSGTTPSGTLSITVNGVYDVTNYASADVSVSGGTSDWVTTKNFTISGRKSHFNIENILDTVGYRIVGEDSDGNIKVVGCLYDANGNVITESNGYYLTFNFGDSEYHEGDEVLLSFYDLEDDTYAIFIHIELS